MSAVRAATHVGICVADLEVSTRFYRDGLGFELLSSVVVGDEFARLMAIEGEVLLEARVLRRDGLSIELLWFQRPGHEESGLPRPLNTLGFTHLSLRVDDVDAVAATIRSLGGAVLEGSRTRGAAVPGDPEGVYLYCTDPDGVRIELVERSGPLDH